MPRELAIGEAYLRQARSDFKVAGLLRHIGGDSLLPRDARCHIAAMCQQAVEKSVKSLYVALGMTPKQSHQVTGFIIDIINVAGGGWRRQACRVFSPAAWQVVRELGELVPKSNFSDPAQAARNSEYPFLVRKYWTAPCDENVFRESEIERYFREAGRIIDGVTRIRASINLTRLN